MRDPNDELIDLIDSGYYSPFVGSNGVIDTGTAGLMGINNSNPIVSIPPVSYHPLPIVYQPYQPSTPIINEKPIYDITPFQQPNVSTSPSTGLIAGSTPAVISTTPPSTIVDSIVNTVSDVINKIVDTGKTIVSAVTGNPVVGQTSTATTNAPTAFSTMLVGGGIILAVFLVFHFVKRKR